MKKFAIYETNLGFIHIDYENDVITYLKQVAEKTTDFRTKNELTDKVYHQLMEYFEGKMKNLILSMGFVEQIFKSKFGVLSVIFRKRLIRWCLVF